MYQVVASLYETNYKEAEELIWTVGTNIKIIVALVISLFLIYLIIVKRNSSQSLSFNKPFSFAVVGVCILCILVAKLIGVRFSRVYPVSAISYNIKYFNEIYSFKRTYANLNYQFSGDIDSPGELKETYILIIGESARKASMSLYGYSRETTPVLQHFLAISRKSIIPYTDATSVSSFTRASVPVMLSSANAKSISELQNYPSIIKIFNAAGYKTFLISSQPRRGFHSDVISTIMNDVMSSIYLEDLNTPDKAYDEAIIPFLQQCLNDSSHKKLILVHLEGSHSWYQKRYPSSHSFFRGDDLVTTYDNSIRYTDFVLGKIINIVLNSEQAISVLYVSDHGENLNDHNNNTFGHGQKHFTKYELEIPFIFIFNPAFVETKTSKVKELMKRMHDPVSHDHVSHTLLGLAGIYDEQEYDESKDLTSPNFLEQDLYVIDRNMNIFSLTLAIQGISSK